MNNERWDDLIQAAQSAACATGVPVAEVPLEEIARRAGISRATLFRRIGSRQALNEALRAAGFDPGDRPDVRERATVAAADLIEEGGLSALTLEAVALRADCSIRALHTQLGGREGLLTAVFERYSPLPRIERAMANGPMSLETGVRTVYGIIFDAAHARRSLLLALIADVAARPDGPTARVVRSAYLPRALGTVVPWLVEQARLEGGRPLPAPLLVQLLLGPMAAHVLLGPVLQREAGLEPPERDIVIAELTGAFMRAVARAPDID